MNKKILPSMIGAALAGGMTVVAADVTVFGHLDSSVDFTDQDGGSREQNLNCTTCSIGFKGSEDLGNGLKAIFKIDFQFDMTERNTGKASRVRPTTTTTTTIGGISTIVTVTAPTVTNVRDTSSITDRDQWLGLAGNFGQIRFGTISTLYKSHGAMLDPFYRTAQQQRDRGLQSDLHRGAGEQGQGRAEDTFRYDSPSWNGLQAAATYTLQTETQTNSTDSPWGVGAQYKNGPFLVFADYITSDEGGDDSAWKLGGKYDWGMFSFLGQYEVDNGLISSLGSNQRWNTGRTRRNRGDGADTWMLGATAKLGNALASFGYGQAKDGSSGSLASKYKVWQLMAAYNFSKRTQVYAGFSEIDCDHADNNVCSKVKFNGGEDDKLSFGMKHKF